MLTTSTPRFHPKLLPRIIEPLASRCSKFRFKPLDSSSARLRLEHIARAEQVPTNQDVISALISTSSGDLRRAITYLQSAARLSASTDPPTAILPRDIQEIAGVVPDAVVRKFAQTLGIDVTLIGGGDGDVEMDDAASLTVETNLRGFDLIRGTVRSLVREGYSASQLLLQVCARSSFPILFVAANGYCPAPRRYRRAPNSDREAKVGLRARHGRSRQSFV